MKMDKKNVLSVLSTEINTSCLINQKSEEIYITTKDICKKINQ